MRYFQLRIKLDSGEQLGIFWIQLIELILMRKTNEMPSRFGHNLDMI